VCAAVGLDPAAGGIERGDTTVCTAKTQYRDEMYSGSQDKEDMVQCEMDALSYNKSKSPNTDGLD
jgi:hypothetical protein